MGENYARWKERTRFYVEGTKQNNGFGLTCHLTERQLYDAANGLLFGGNFLYACDVSESIVMKSVSSNLHQSQSRMVTAYLARLCSATYHSMTWYTTSCTM